MVMEEERDGESIHQHGQEEKWENGRKAIIRNDNEKNLLEECMYIPRPLIL